MKPLRLILAGVVLGLVSLAAPLHGQSTEAEIKARLKGKPLYLRGFWGVDSLSFDAAGNLTSKSGTVSFTLSGFDFSYAHLKRDKLTIGGRRVVTEFARDTPKRARVDSDISMEIALPPSGDFGPALDAIFADGLPALAPSLPSYWQAFARCHLTEATTSTDCSLSPNHVPGYQPDISITPPRVRKDVAAAFNSYAVQLDYSGVSVVHFAVTRDGLPAAIAILHPTGVGLDEQAIAAVAQYSFSPAMKDGAPVAFDMTIDVRFDL